MRGVQEPPETPGPKDGSGTLGLRAGLACSGSREKKVTRVSREKGGLLSGTLARDGQRPPPTPAPHVLNILLVLKGPEGSQDSWAT